MREKSLKKIWIKLSRRNIPESFKVTIGLVFVLMCGGCITEKEVTGENDLQPGDTLPFFTVTMNTGEEVSTESLRGKESMIVFFNTECADCRKELPVIDEFWQLRGNEVNVVCISRAEGETAVASYWEENGLTLPYSAQDNRCVYDLFAPTIIPRIYVSGPDLVIRKVWTDNPMPSLEDLTE